jgi:protein ImuB
LTAAPLQTWQPELFEPSHSESRRQVGLLVDRLSSRLGSEAVVRAVPKAAAQPELAFWYEPLAGVSRRTTKQRWKSLPRPLRLESEPIPLEVLSVVPNGPPIQFQFHGQHRVAHAWGPERIQTGWWRGRSVQRDYYRIETTSGRRFWLFRCLSDRKWFLHGAFD